MLAACNSREDAFFHGPMTFSILPDDLVFEFKVSGGFPQSAENGLELHFNWLSAEAGVLSERRATRRVIYRRVESRDDEEPSGDPGRR